MPQYRDLYQSSPKKVRALSDRMKKLIQKEKDSYKTHPICEFCDNTYNESKTEDCFTCECMREGRSHPKTTTLREDCKESNTPLRSVGLTERENE